MKIALALVGFAGLLVPASPALAAPAGTPAPVLSPAPAPRVAPTETPAAAASTTPAPTGTVALVARYNFDAGAVGGKVADSSGRGTALTVRSADQGALRFTGGYASFPAACATGATVCPRALLEAPDDADLNPGTRLFRWSARINVTKAQLVGSSNVLQKGVANSGSQWKMQIGATQGRAQCVVVGTGSSVVYVARSAATVADGQWHKVLCQRSGTTLAVFVDDVQRGQTTIPSTLSFSSTLPLRVGGANFSGKSDMYHGSIDDIYAELG